MNRVSTNTVLFGLVAAVCVIFSAFATTPAYAGGGGSSAKPLEPAYPIVLSHGLFGWGEDSSGAVNIANYWGGMDDYLRSEGAAVYAPGKTALQATAPRAAQMRDSISYWMAANDYTRVHVMGHSQGGLDGRYMISNLGIAPSIASLTTISTPHRGSPVADVIQSVLPNWLEPYLATVLNGLARLLYSDNNQDALAVLYDVDTNAMNVFNATTPDIQGVRYFSYTSRMTWSNLLQHPIMGLLYPACYAGGIAKGLGGANDGLVPVASAKWGEYMGEPSHAWWVSGIDHMQIINMFGTGQPYFDVEGFYLQMSRNAMNNQ